MSDLLRPMTRADAVALLGEAPQRTMRGVAWETDGRPVALLAIVFPGPDQIPQLISHASPAAIARGHNFVRWARRALEMVVTEPVLAVADNPNSARFLGYMGAEFVTGRPDGLVFRFSPVTKRKAA